MKRIPEIDGLRGIAILLVVSFHYVNNQLTNSTNFIGKVLCKVTGFGWVGVDLFFVLSGFLIGSVLLANKQSENYFKTFYIRRIVRIIPNYYLLLVVFLIVISIDAFKSNSFLTGENIIPLWSYFLLCQNFFMAKFNSLGNHPMGVTWSIAIEEQFYILIPFILYKLRNNWVPFVLAIITIVALIARTQFEDWLPRYVLLICRADSLSLGILIAWIKLNFNCDGFVARNRKSLLAILVADLLICGFCYAMFGDLGVFKHTLFAIIFSIMVLFAIGHNQNIYGAFLRTKWLNWIGAISYSLYLFHDYVIGITYHLFGKNGVMISGVYDIGITVFAFFLSLLISYVIYLYLETPMIKIGKKYKY